MSFNAKVFGERVKELRNEKGLTTVQLGIALGVSDATISRWENGLINPSVESVFKMAKFFNAPAGYIIGAEEM